MAALSGRVRRVVAAAIAAVVGAGALTAVARAPSSSAAPGDSDSGWTAPVAVSTVDESASEPVLSGDGRTLVWTATLAGQSAVRVSRFADGTWSAPETLSDGAGSMVAPSVSTDGTKVAWTDYSGACSCFQWRSYAVGAWGPARTITTDGSYHMLSADGLTAVWWGNEPLFTQRVWVSRFAHNAWSSPVVVSDPTVDSVPLSVSGDGNTIAVLEGSPNPRLRVARHSAGSWSLSPPLTPAGEWADQAWVAADGNTIVWQRRTPAPARIEGSRYLSGAWTAPEPISDPGPSASRPRVDAAGTVVAWNEIDSGFESAMVSRRTDAGWSSPDYLATPDSQVRGIEVSGDGRLVAWRYDDSADVQSGIGSSRWEDGYWSDRTTLRLPIDVVASDPTLSDDGRVVSWAEQGEVLVVRARPVVYETWPDSGPLESGTSVTIYGSLFDPDATVIFGGVPVAVTGRVGTTELTVVAPAHAAGRVDVTVANPDGLSGTLADGYWYQGPPGPMQSITVTFGSDAGASAPAATTTEPAGVVAQVPRDRLTLPKKLARSGRTVLLRRAVVTNAGQTASVAVRVRPRKAARTVRVLRRSSGRVLLSLSGARRTRITVTLSASAVPGFTAYEQVKRYVTRAASG